MNRIILCFSVQAFKNIAGGTSFSFNTPCRPDLLEIVICDVLALPFMLSISIDASKY